MSATRSRIFVVTWCAVIGAMLIHSEALLFAQNQGSATAGSIDKAIGAIKAVNGTAITLTPDAGPDVSVAVQTTTQILRVEPGAKNLGGAVQVQLQDLQIGDRIRVTGRASDDNRSLIAAKIIAIKRLDLEALHERDLEDWQKRGVGGLVSGVDSPAGTVTISVVTFTGSRKVVVSTSRSTLIRRYSPDSVKFDDAKPGTLDQIHPGDQLRARGNRSPDGAELTAQEVVSGAFRNVAGTVSSVDIPQSTLSVHDLLSKKIVVVKIAPDSQLRRFPPEMARRVAMRLKGAAAGTSAESSSSASPRASSADARRGASPGANGMGAHSGAPDFQQMLNRMPAVSLADLHKDDAVMIVSTEGASGVGTAITLLAGVEPILQAAPNANGTAMLTPWSLSVPSGDSGGP